MSDQVNNPSHYTYGKVELIDIIEYLPFWKGNVLKYVYRAGYKKDELEDLKKAKWYLDRRIKQLEENLG